MSEAAPPLNASPPSHTDAVAVWFRNPVTIKELRSRMRGRRAPAVLTLYLAIMAAVITLVYLAYVSSTSSVGNPGARTAGKGLFAAVLAVQVFMVLFIAPSFTAGAISGERERQTFDLLRTTLLSAEAFVLGKLISALSYIFLLILASIPLMSIAFLLGGLSLTELVIAEVLVLVAAVAYAMYGLWCSATLRTTLAATVTTFAGVLLVTFGIPLFIAAAVAVFGTLMITSPWAGISATLVQIALTYVGLLLAATNLPATLIVSESFLLNENAVFAFSQFIYGTRYWVISPWTIFIVLHVATAVILFVMTVRRVRRVSDV